MACTTMGIPVVRYSQKTVIGEDSALPNFVETQNLSGLICSNRLVPILTY